jgi:hypothetical protein
VADARSAAAVYRQSFWRPHREGRLERREGRRGRLRRTSNGIGPTLALLHHRTEQKESIMPRAILQIVSSAAVSIALLAPAQAATWTSCPAGPISYYLFDAPVPSLLVQQEYFQGPVWPLDGGPAEPRIAREMTTDPALGSLLYGVCADQVAAFEAMAGVVTSERLSSELYLLRDGGGQVLGTRFLDRNNDAQGGGIAVQAFFHCSTVTVDGFVFNNWPMLVNASLFHTGADLMAISATPAQIEQHWTGPLRQRVLSATEAWVTSSTACTPIDKSDFAQMVEAGPIPVIQNLVVDPGHNVDTTVP